MRIIFWDKYKKFLSFGIITSLIVSTLAFGRQNFVVESANLVSTKNVINYNKTNDGQKNVKNIIPIAMATDNNYLDITLVSILSAIENADKNTRLNFYIMVTGDFSENNKQKVQKIIDAFKNCTIELINMRDSFKEFYTGHWGPAMYYKIETV